MHNAAYRDLIQRLDKVANSAQSDADALRMFESIRDHMDALVQASSSTAAVGHLFVSRFFQEWPLLHTLASAGTQCLGREAFKWSMSHEDWTSAAWLICHPGLVVPLSHPLHPHPGILHALVCNDSLDWPPTYMAALLNNAVVRDAMVRDEHHPLPYKSYALDGGIENDYDRLAVRSERYARQIRKACYFGPGDGLHAVKIAMAWLQLHHESGGESHLLPAKMSLRHHHPQQGNLTRLLQNQWRVDQFWETGDIDNLNHLQELSCRDFQSWYWLLTAQGYEHHGRALTEKIPVWNHWWKNKNPDAWTQSGFWLNLWTQAHGLDSTRMRKPERLVAVRDALALASQPPLAACELPEGCLEFQGVEPLRSRLAFGQ